MARLLNANSDHMLFPPKHCDEAMSEQDRQHTQSEKHCFLSKMAGTGPALPLSGPVP